MVRRQYILALSDLRNSIHWWAMTTEPHYFRTELHWGVRVDVSWILRLPRSLKTKSFLSLGPPGLSPAYVYFVKSLSGLSKKKVSSYHEEDLRVSHLEIITHGLYVSMTFEMYFNVDDGN